MLALLICTASFIFSKACLYGTSLKEGLFAPRMCPLFLKITSQKITKESLISIWITLHVFSCHLFIYSYPCGFHTRKVVGSSPARNIFDHKLNFSFVILFSWEPYPVWVCKKHLPVRESVRPTNDRTAIDRYCSSIICHLEFHRLSTIVENAVSAHQNTHTEKSLFTFWLFDQNYLIAFASF